MLSLGAARHDDNRAVAGGFRAAIEEAARFIGATAPNPPVGCAILDAEGTILAVAAHHRAGEPHAEALALQVCREAGTLDRAVTAIVTLEPCNHTGRTPPCTKAILASPLRSVWIGASDPNPLVTGGGAARLAAAGLDVHWPAANSDCARDCAALIAPFATRVTDARPWITVKQALDASGGMIPPAGARTFTGPAALALAHRLRRASDAIITGVGTILADRPHFTVRHVPDHPTRRRLIGVVDRAGGVPEDWRRETEARGLGLRTAPDLPSLLRRLADEGALWALVEAGPRLLACIEQDALWDDWLSISQDRQGRDHVSLRSRKAISPLRLIEGVASARQEVACSPAS
ncbi:bifunctional diaminohydroxyphosphoribosylaminopyrimidine deaminase/5-amino-6-(5-phosphoribosylamino)uracil reductase RibD [Lichenicoccus sp.]|uniref:bifunctional diaminohydroxyphosphoribosylaminopyrimidine deaminase/5-amino-6-(5-phosphoribosylamino)uracil reductase RibD n=1 Tax=Lichenicoccus sp. TaxID=2781899 RepID=UPI003D0DAB9F